MDGRTNSVSVYTAGATRVHSTASLFLNPLASLDLRGLLFCSLGDDWWFGRVAKDFNFRMRDCRLPNEMQELLCEVSVFQVS